MQQNFHRVITRIDSGRERLPFRVRGPDECGLRRIAGNAAIETSNFKINGRKGSEAEKEKCGVSAAGPEKLSTPLSSPGELRPALPPAFRQEIELDRGGRRFDTHEFGRAGQDSLHGIAQLIITLVE